jgi:hypothetical protein
MRKPPLGKRMMVAGATMPLLFDHFGSLPATPRRKRFEQEILWVGRAAAVPKKLEVRIPIR